MHRLPRRLLVLCAILSAAGAVRADSIAWNGWSDEVFARARREHKFVLLDLEAVWCHWCHVMDATTYRDPRVIARLYSGWAVFGERQFLRGYALLLPDPVVPSLNALGAQERTGFLLDMARLGDALLKVTGAIRINYAIYGNIEPALHAHVIPRYADEVDKLRTAQPWAYDWAAAPAFDRTAYQELAEALRKELTRMGVTKQMRFDPGANVNGGG